MAFGTRAPAPTAVAVLFVVMLMASRPIVGRMYRSADTFPIHLRRQLEP